MGAKTRFVFFIVFAALAQAANASDIDRSAVDFTVPKDIKWVKNPGGTASCLR